MKQKTLRQLEKEASTAGVKWNAKYPVGQKVQLLKDDGAIVETETTSEAAVMCCQAVIWLKGISGCYALSRCTPIATSAEA